MITLSCRTFFFFSVRGPLTAVASPVAEQQALDAQAQRPWLTGPATAWHVASSRTGAQTRVPCIGRQTLNHCATKEALHFFKAIVLVTMKGMRVDFFHLNSAKTQILGTSRGHLCLSPSSACPDSFRLVSPGSWIS